MAANFFDNALRSGLSAYQIGSQISGERRYRKAREAAFDAGGDYGTLRDVAIREGRWQDAQGFHGLMQAETAKLDKDRSRFAKQGLAMYESGDIEGFKGLVSQTPPAVFGLEKHRKPTGIRRVKRTVDTPDGTKDEVLWALEVANGKTKTKGPMTQRGTPDADDNVVYLRDEQLRDRLRFWAGGRQRKVKHGWRGQLYDEGTGEELRGPYDEQRDPPGLQDLGNGFKFNPDTNTVIDTNDPLGEAFDDAYLQLDSLIPKQELAASLQPDSKRELKANVGRIMDEVVRNYGADPRRAVQEVLTALTAETAYKEAMEEGDLEEMNAIAMQIAETLGPQLPKFRRPTPVMSNVGQPAAAVGLSAAGGYAPGS